jgi:large subunit ribosomal protein L35
LWFPRGGSKRTRRLSADKILAPGDAKVAKKLLGI